mmetsp:Transcript_61367/g.190201  ORF Transcript_61367/g.190201 Transcript_61367/m.190201 type:complete len:302 (-) Transcript_61367:64-969(-)
MSLARLAYGHHILRQEVYMLIAADPRHQLPPTFERPTRGSSSLPEERPGGDACEKGAGQELIETVNVLAGDNLDPVVAPPCDARAILDVPNITHVVRAPVICTNVLPSFDGVLYIEQNLVVRQLPVEDGVPHVDQEPCVVAGEDRESVLLASALPVLHEEPKCLGCVGGLARVAPLERLEDFQARSEHLRQHAVVLGRVVHRKDIHLVAVLLERLNDQIQVILPVLLLDVCPLGLRNEVATGAAPAERLAPQNQGNPARERAWRGLQRDRAGAAALDAQRPAGRRAKTQCNEESMHCCQAA